MKYVSPSTPMALAFLFMGLVLITSSYISSKTNYEQIILIQKYNKINPAVIQKYDNKRNKEFNKPFSTQREQITDKDISLLEQNLKKAEDLDAKLNKIVNSKAFKKNFHQYKQKNDLMQRNKKSISSKYY
ncbi:MAG: hypothetical protein ABIC91_07440 [Nanoarchaeota archaeon]|nr:hypothetical protein [Nanoarchaeota archaeon]MBU1030722.1 hypothetical protein [Nanoarchaeota archaeon]MBU1849189.1 hypothetical protein [Nanoarchaeota archaeon]